MAPPTARVQFAPNDDTLVWDPTWEDLDDQVRVAAYTIDRGRTYELDTVDTGRATITINDTEGLLDPTNPAGPWYNSDEANVGIQPLKQARLAVWNPVLEDWYTRYRGFVESYVYDFDPSQRVNRITISLVDLFDIVSAVQMFPGNFGDPAPSDDQVFMESTADGDGHGMQRRVKDILGEPDPPGDSTFALGSCGFPADFYQVFSGNVSLHEGHYSAGESAMAAVQEAVNAEFIGVGSAYVDRLGRFCVHGRFARFDPVGTAAATGGVWDFHDWKAGDGAEVLAHPSDTAHIRAFTMSRDIGKIINVASASPASDDPVADFTTQVEVATASKNKYGIRAWSTDGLLTKEGVTDGLLGAGADWAETKLYAKYYKDNFHVPRTRVTTITFRSMDVDQAGAAANWALLSEVDLSDRVYVTMSSPGGGGIEDVPYFVEGIREEHRPLNDRMDDVTISLDLSPADYYQDSPFAT